MICLEEVKPQSALPITLSPGNASGNY